MRFRLKHQVILISVCSALATWHDVGLGADTLPELVAGLQRATISADELRGYETDLKESPAEKVLPLLLPLVSQGMPSGPIWNGSSLENDMNAPLKWRVFYSTNRVWRDLAVKNPAIAGNLLANACAESKSGGEKAVLLGQLKSCWNKKAEIIAAEILRNWRKEPEAWTVAANCLAEHHRTKYDAILVRVLTELPDENLLQKSKYVRMLVKHRIKALRIASRGNSTPGNAIPSINLEILRIGYSLIEKMEDRDKGLAYFLALDMGLYVGQNFKPDQNAPRFSSAGGGLNEEFFAETSSTALRWWKANRSSYPESK